MNASKYKEEAGMGLSRALLVPLMILALVAGSQQAAAITYGEPDGEAHPHVALIVFYKFFVDPETKEVDESKFVPIWRCSGTQISDTVVLTAGHCTAPDGDDLPVRAQVWFDSEIVRPPLKDEAGESEAYRPDPGKPCLAEHVAYPCVGGDAFGTPVTNPNWNDFGSFPQTHDYGAVLLGSAGVSGAYPELADVGTLDSLATQRGRQSLTVVAVGYGLRLALPIGSVSVAACTDADGVCFVRAKASQKINDVRSALTGGFSVRTTNSPGLGTGDGSTKPGGTCFGDSGGPVFYQGKIVGITSFGLNGNCKGGDYFYRADLQAVQAWLADLD